MIEKTDGLNKVFSLFKNCTTPMLPNATNGINAVIFKMVNVYAVKSDLKFKKLFNLIENP